MKYHIQTFGCQMNYSDTERVETVLEKNGYAKAKTLEEVDLFIFNTCSIRQKGEDRVHGLLGKLAQYKKANPRLLIGITGCMVRQTSSRNSENNVKDKLLTTAFNLDFVFRINDTHKLAEVLAEAEPQLELQGAEEKPSENRTDYLKVDPKYSSKIQAFVPIQIGCDKYCTYCIVPYSRGREESRDLAEIVSECRKLVENGCKEITLVGQTVNSYGLSDLDKKSARFTDFTEQPFIKLLKELNALSELGLSRLRYTSPHPRDFTDELIEAHANLKTLCPYIHLPVQAGDNTVLAKMNRKYTVEHYRGIIEKIKTRLPNCVISTDIIVGFCGETDEQFENTFNLFQDLKFDHAFIARYSTRKETVSEKYFQDDVTKEKKAERWNRLNDLLVATSTHKNQAYEGQELEVLVERFNTLTKELEGRSREYKLVQFKGDESQVGKIQQVKILKGLPWVLKGEI